MRMHLYVCDSVCTHVFVYVMYVCYVGIYVCMYVFMYVCMYVILCVPMYLFMSCMYVMYVM
jgi:hypothetical protein